MIIILLLALISFSFTQDTLIRWEEEINLSQDTVYNFYPWIECQDNYVHIVWAELDKGVYYQRSINSGITWSEPFRLHSDTTIIIHPKLALGGEKVYCVWDAAYNVGWHLRFTRSTDLGETWSSPFHITDPPIADAVKCRNIVANDLYWFSGNRTKQGSDLRWKTGYYIPSFSPLPRPVFHTVC